MTCVGPGPRLETLFFVYNGQEVQNTAVAFQKNVKFFLNVFYTSGPPYRQDAGIHKCIVF